MCGGSNSRLNTGVGELSLFLFSLSLLSPLSLSLLSFFLSLSNLDSKKLYCSSCAHLLSSTSTTCLNSLAAGFIYGGKGGARNSIIFLPLYFSYFIYFFFSLFPLHSMQNFPRNLWFQSFYIHVFLYLVKSYA